MMGWMLVTVARAGTGVCQTTPLASLNVLFRNVRDCRSCAVKWRRRMYIKKAQVVKSVCLVTPPSPLFDVT
jgi:hypothetical protein